MMDHLPPEIACHMLSFCDFTSIVRLLSVNHKWNSLACHILSRKLSLDHHQELKEVFNSELIQSTKIEDFIIFLLMKVPNIRILRINHPRMKIACSDCILFARSLPNLEVLEIEQDENNPQVDYDALYSLCFFKNLKHLSLKGWNKFNCAGRGAIYRSTLPYGHFLFLESLKLHGTPTILDFLVNITSYTSKMDYLKEIELIFTDDSEKSILFLTQFLINHSQLNSIILENLRFNQTTQIESFLRLFVHMIDLKKLQLNNFDFPSTMDTGLVCKFVDSMSKRGVFLQVNTLNVKFEQRILSSKTLREQKEVEKSLSVEETVISPKNIIQRLAQQLQEISIFHLIGLSSNLIPAVMVTLGIVHIHDCPLEPLIPIWLIVSGILYLLTTILDVVFCFRPTYDRPLPIRIVDYCIVSCMLGWLVLGSVWVYSAEGNDHCQSSVFYLAHVLITLSYLSIVLIIILLIIIGGMVAILG